MISDTPVWVGKAQAHMCPLCFPPPPTPSPSTASLDLSPPWDICFPGVSLCNCRVEEGQVLFCSRSGTLDLTLRQRLSCPDNPQLISAATPPAKVAQPVLGHRLPEAIKIAEALQLLNDEFWKEMIDSHS